MGPETRDPTGGTLDLRPETHLIDGIQDPRHLSYVGPKSKGLENGTWGPWTQRDPWTQWDPLSA